MTLLRYRWIEYVWDQTPDAGRVEPVTTEWQVTRRAYPSRQAAVRAIVGRHDPMVHTAPVKIRKIRLAGHDMVEAYHPGDPEINDTRYYRVEALSAEETEANQPPTGDGLRRQRTALGLTQAQLAATLECAPNTVARWERGELTIPRTVQLAVERLVSLPREERA